MDVSKELEKVVGARLKYDEPMSAHTTYKVGGPAKYYADVTTTQELVDLVVIARKHKIPVFILGGGSNILVSDKGFKGLVIVEGPMDALAASECGFVGVGLMGATPPGEVLDAIARLRAAMGSPRHSEPGTHMPVLVVADEGALGAATAVWRHFPGALLLNTYPNKDLAEVPLSERKELLA